MAFDVEKQHRRSVRLPGYDYGLAGAYFVTLCTANRRCAFGRIVEFQVELHRFGRIAQKCWLAIPEHYPSVELDAFVAMPNHLHGVLLINSNANSGAKAEFSKPISGSLFTIINRYKGAVTREISALREEPTKVWQRGFYEHIIRSEQSLENVRRYIENNSANWKNDEHYME